MTGLKNVKHGAICIGFVATILLYACKSGQDSGVAEIHPLTSFSQEITAPIHEFQVNAGGAYTLDINVKNTGTQPWFGGARPMMVAAGYRWLDSVGNALPIEGNRAQLSRPVVQPGESDQLKMQVVAPP